MANYFPRQRSRRNLAALTFLSNISLDGTHRDTNLYGYKHGNIFHCEEDSVAKENISHEQHGEDCNGNHAKRVKIGGENIIDESSEVFNVASQVSLTNQRHITPDTVKKPLRNASVSAMTAGSCLSSSSSESLVPSVVGTRIRKVSSTWSEASAPAAKEVKSIKFSSSIHVREERLVILSSEKYPFHIASFIPYNKNRTESYAKESRKRHVSGTRPLSTISDSTDPAHLLGMVGYEEAVEVSYFDFLVPSRCFSKGTNKRQQPDACEMADPCPQHPGLARCFSYEPATHRATAHYIPHGTHVCSDKGDMQITPYPTKNDIYVPNIIDDPELQAGKHRKLLRFPTYMTSVLDYTKRCDLKKELNDKFKCKFPHIQLTLSKLRSIKREMLKIATVECCIDLLTVAYAYVYFEQLIMKSIVNKETRKLVAAACLILAAKMNDVKGETLSTLMEKTESIFRLNRRDLMQWEVASLVALQFGLHIPVWQVKPHYQRLLFES